MNDDLLANKQNKISQGNYLPSFPGQRGNIAKEQNQLGKKVQRGNLITRKRERRNIGENRQTTLKYFMQS